MANLILQHFNGKLRELDQLSVDNIKAYAERIGAEHKLIGGKPFRENLTNPCQKAIIIDEQWDDYDNVLMLDPDMFVTKTNTENVFNVPGHGSHGPTQVRLKQRLFHMTRIGAKSPYWAGSFYKFDRQTRQALRKQMPNNDDWMLAYNEPYFYEDEGILAELAFKARLSESYIGVEWNLCSFLNNIESAKMIHIRTKKPGHPNGSWEDGGKQDKIKNYQELVDKGII